MAKLYQDQLEQVLEDISQLSRKYTYVLPDQRTLYDPATQFEHLWIDGSAPNGEGMILLKARVDKMAAQLVEDQSGQTASKNLFPAEDERGDLFVHIQEGPLLDRFRKSQRIRFKTVSALDTIDPKAKVVEVQVENSDRYWDVRITHAQVRIVGASATHKQLFIGLRMASFSSIYGVKSKYTFSYHGKRGEAEQPRYATMLQATDARVYEDTDRKVFCTGNTDIGGDRGKLTDGFLDAPGMFSTWELSLPTAHDAEGHNAGLDLSKVTEISIHFRGWRRGSKT